MTNFFTLIPAKYRLRIYMAYAAVGVIIGSVQVGFAAVDSKPAAIDIFTKVYAYLAVPLGITAASNVTTSSGPPPAPESNPLRPDDEQDEVVTREDDEEVVLETDPRDEGISSEPDGEGEK